MVKKTQNKTKAKTTTAESLGKKGGKKTLEKHGRDHYKKMIEKRWHNKQSPKPGNKKFDFEGLFTLDMANNHSGDLAHAKKLIQEFSKVIMEKGVRASIKFQYRHYNSIVHPDYQGENRKENKTVNRFLSTRLTDDEFGELVNECKKNNLITMSTPFDEKSVELIEKFDLDVIKIASCSAKDWPLLERVVRVGKPIIISTGGISIEDIDNIVSFFDHRYVNYALMHCVAIYPTPTEKLQLNQIRLLKERYPHITIGYSTHEDPNNTEAIQQAYAYGARLFERHIGIATLKIKLNEYSSTPKQIGNWIDAYKRVVTSSGNTYRPDSDPKELMDLRQFMRGVYVNRYIKKGEIIQEEDIFYAIPIQNGQISAGEFKRAMVADQAYKVNEPINENILNSHVKTFIYKEAIYQALHKVKGMLREARITPGDEVDVELSHHYGLENFYKTGVIIISCINREYCKKILVQLPGQYHPCHHHQKKEEAFHMLSGKLEIELNGKQKILYPGDVLVIKRGVKHSFWTDRGAVFEEISTTHFNDDSFYADVAINNTPREERKTKLNHWGRHQFD